MEKYSLRKIRALCRAAAENRNEEMKSFGKEVGIGCRHGMNATAEEFNRWLKE
jgi:hypothetical protein